MRVSFSDFNIKLKFNQANLEQSSTALFCMVWVPNYCWFKYIYIWLVRLVYHYSRYPGVWITSWDKIGPLNRCKTLIQKIKINVSDCWREAHFLTFDTREIPHNRTNFPSGGDTAYIYTVQYKYYSCNVRLVDEGVKYYIIIYPLTPRCQYCKLHNSYYV